MDRQEQFEQRLQEIRQRFINKLDDNLPQFKEFHTHLKTGNTDFSNLEDIRMRVHKLAGSAKVFGFEKVSNQARDIQTHLDHLIENDGFTHPYTELISKLDQFLSELESVSATKT